MIKMIKKYFEDKEYKKLQIELDKEILLEIIFNCIHESIKNEYREHYWESNWEDSIFRYNLSWDTTNKRNRFPKILKENRNKINDYADIMIMKRGKFLIIITKEYDFYNPLMFDLEDENIYKAIKLEIDSTLRRAENDYYANIKREEDEKIYKELARIKIIEKYKLSRS